MTRIIPVTDLRNKFPEVEQMVSSGDPVYLTKNGTGSMVLMSIEAYDALIENLEISAKLLESERSVIHGDVYSHEEAYQKIMEALHGK